MPELSARGMGHISFPVSRLKYGLVMAPLAYIEIFYWNQTLLEAI